MVNTRFRPTGYRPIHVGHILPMLDNATMAWASGGKFHLIFDDINCRLQQTQLQGYRVDHALELWLEDMEWMGIAPDEVHLSSENVEGHAEAAEKLGLTIPGGAACTNWRSLTVNQGVQPGCLFPYSWMGIETWRTMGYHPWYVAVKCADDRLWGINLFVRGADLVGEQLLYHDTWIRLYGGNPPYQRYVPTVRREEKTEKESKGMGSIPISSLRDVGYTPKQIIGTLLECSRRSHEIGMWEVIVPKGILEEDHIGVLEYQHPDARDYDPNFDEAWGEDVKSYMKTIRKAWKYAD